MNTSSRTPTLWQSCYGFSCPAVDWPQRCQRSGPEKISWRLNDAYHAPKSVGGHVRIYSKEVLKARLTTAGFETGESHRAHALHSPYWWLKCAVGLDNEDHPAVQKYLQFLTWDIVKAPMVTRLADKVLNPVLGKSLVLYADKPA